MQQGENHDSEQSDAAATMHESNIPGLYLNDVSLKTVFTCQKNCDYSYTAYSDGLTLMLFFF